MFQLFRDCGAGSALGFLRLLTGYLQVIKTNLSAFLSEGAPLDALKISPHTRVLPRLTPCLRLFLSRPVVTTCRFTEPLITNILSDLRIILERSCVTMSGSAHWNICIRLHVKLDYGT